MTASTADGYDRKQDRWKSLRPGVVAVVGLTAGLCVWLLALANGFFVNSLVMWLGLLLPLLTLGLMALALFLALAFCIWIFLVERTAKNVVLVFLAVLGPAIAFGGPRTISGFDAFVFRLERYSEAEYRAVAADVKAVLKAQGVRGLPYGPRSEEPLGIPAELVGSHRILAVSDFPLHLMDKGDAVGLMWGSGLTGGYTVEILVDDDPPPGWADSLRQRSFDLPVAYIYDGVAAARLP